jgi:hypothetical protein
LPPTIVPEGTSLSPPRRKRPRSHRRS